MISPSNVYTFILAPLSQPDASLLTPPKCIDLVISGSGLLWTSCLTKSF